MNRVSLKNVKHYPTLSEETNCFTAVVYFDGKKVGECENRGYGGATICRFTSREKEVEVEAYCKSLPNIIYGEHTFDSNLEFVLDKCFEDWISEREEKRMQKDFDKGICYGTPQSYYITYFQVGGKKISISEVLKRVDGLALLRNSCEKLIKEGHMILNTNLPFNV
jgi:hypothetical protein